MYRDTSDTVPTLARILTSLMAHLLNQTSTIEEPQAVLDHDLIKLVPKLSKDMRTKLENEILQESLKFGHFYAHALKYVKISSFDDICTKVYITGHEQITLPVLHTMQVLVSIPLHNDANSEICLQKIDKLAKN